MNKNSFVSKLFLVTIAILAIVSLSLVSANAQTISGNLVGTVLDPSGAAVPNATVTATNIATGVKSETTTSSTGDYRIANLPVGSYDITASAAGFQASTLKNYQIELNKTSTAKLSVSVTNTTSVDVNANATVIDNTTAQIQNTFDQRQNVDLPTASIGSGVINLSLLGAGVGSSGGIGAGTGPSVGGQRPRNNNFTVEGIDNNSKSVTGPNFTVPGEAVSNFTVMQNQFNAEFGHSSGGQFNQVITSGTNRYHGGLYEYFQNRNLNAIDANIARNTTPGQTPFNPRFDNNRFGGKVGGPIVPNKLFFFFLYDFAPTGQAAVPNQLCAPTQAGYATLATIPGLSATNVGQFKTYMPTAAVQDSLVAAQAVCPTKIPGFITVNGTNVPVGVANIVAPNFINNKALVSSADWDITANDKLRGRYLWNNNQSIDTAASLPQFYLPVPVVNHLFTLSEFHTFSPTVQNELRLGFNRFAQTIPAGNFAYPGLDSFPNIEIDELGVSIGPDGNAPQFTIQNFYTAADNLSWLKGNHDLRFGYQFGKYISPQSFTQRARGDYDYATADPFFQDLGPDILGERSLGNPVYYGDQIASYWYVNDNWKLRPNFTLNLGLRHEYTTIPQGERLQSLNQAASVAGLVDFSEPRAPKTNFMPRLGFAWSPGGNQNTSVRGGFSMAYDVLYDNIGILSLPPQLSGTIDTDLTPSDNPNFLKGGGILPSAGGIQTFPDLATQRAFTANHIVVDQKDPYSESWNLGIQRTFGSAYTAEIRYVGTKGIHLNTQERINIQSKVTSNLFLPTFIGSVPAQAQLDAMSTTLSTIRAVSNIVPAYNTAGFNAQPLVQFTPNGNSIYHGLQTQLTRSFTNGLEFTGAYTWSRTIDDSTADFFSTVLTPRRQQNFQNLAADRTVSALSRTHRFTFSALYQTPWFKQGNWLARNLLGNWTLAPIYTYESPEWGTVQSVVDSNLDGDSAGDRTIFNPSGLAGTGSDVTPLCKSTLTPANPGVSRGAVCGLGADPGDPTATPVILPRPSSFPFVVGYSANNPNAQYIVAGSGALSNAQRNTLATRPIDNFDLTVGKDLGFTENTKFQFQAKFFNLFNHPQFIPGSINDVASIGNTSVRTSLLNPASSTFNKPELAFASNARVMQLVVKFIF
jgi:hypothetical protein